MSSSSLHDILHTHVHHLQSITPAGSSQNHHIRARAQDTTSQAPEMPDGNLVRTYLDYFTEGVGV